MDLLQQFRDAIKEQDLFSEKDSLLLAVSGGVDSVVLCELCQQAGYSFSIAHCNFRLRGAESERDAQFVAALGEKYGVKVMVREFDTEAYANAQQLSIQEAARALRYGWFRELVDQFSITGDIVKPVYLLTAHHADDDAETLLMNFFRGTGLQGLTGIPPVNNHIRRPLLSFQKEELLAFAGHHQLAFVEDSSNLSSKYTRNFFRNEILPAIRQVYPQVGQNLRDNLYRFREIHKLYRLGVDGIIARLMRQKGNDFRIPVKQLMDYDNDALVYEIISRFGFTEKQVAEVAKLAESASGKFIQSPHGNYRLIKHRHWFIISPVDHEAAAICVIQQHEKNILFQGGKLLIEKIAPGSSLKSATGHVASFDAADIIFPLVLRKWKAGDYFYPLGMRKKKKLARFFIDQKLSISEKEKVWVLESNQRIIWVLGMRIDDRVKVTDNTKQVLRITWEN